MDALEFRIKIPLSQLYRRISGVDDFSHFHRLLKLVSLDRVLDGRHGPYTVEMAWVDGSGNKTLSTMVGEQVQPNVEVSSDDVI